MRSSAELREAFLAFFEREGHKRVRSHSLIPPADPTLLFVNAGMVQFKDVFVGHKKVDFRRATSSQKCLRVSGKHNDLEKVGRTARHHTFFEMLGNFSFGDYFKREAISFAYNFLVKELGLDSRRCYYTVFEGDPEEGLPPDEEAVRFWKETAGVGEERILRFGKKDNFWAMGETGPCGPCSEILYDRGEGPWACGRKECAPGCDCDRYVELWNLVFMEFDRKQPGGPLDPLPAPSIDTGMGLERLACVIQGTPTNYETDMFMPLIVKACELLKGQTGKNVVYGEGGEDDVALRVIGDHARAAAFLVADGVYPDNEGRGYIARLLIRRAVSFGRKLGFTGPFFAHVADRVVELMSEPYPELADRAKVIHKVVSLEEESFSQTYDEGAAVVQAELDRLAKTGESRVGGEFLFWLHDERGFQPDLVEIIAAERGFSIDREGYRALMDKKRRTSGKAMKEHDQSRKEVWRTMVERVGASSFVGYDGLDTTGEVQALVASSGNEVDELSAENEGEVVLSRTTFYAESGGQVGDTGELLWRGGNAVVLDTQKLPGDVFLHRVKVQQGALRKGVIVEAKVDPVRRAGIRAHHSATHLLHWALEQVLGPHVKQEGSLVRDDMLRFDFRHFSPLQVSEIEKIEELVETKVLENSPVETVVTGIEQAMAMGAKAFFGEKYAQEVRMVTIGGVSRELCGGTHVFRTGDIGLVKITKQEAVSSGIRRIYAVCHMAAVRYVSSLDRSLARLAALLKTGPDGIELRVHKLLERDAKHERLIKELEQKLLAARAAGKKEGHTVEMVGSTKVAYTLLEDADESATRTMADLLRDRLGEGIVMVGRASGGKLLVVVAKTAGAPTRFHSGKVVSQIATALGGRGGGRPDFAQAGGCDTNRWEEAVNLLRHFVMEAQ